MTNELRISHLNHALTLAQAAREHLARATADLADANARTTLFHAACDATDAAGTAITAITAMIAELRTPTPPTRGPAHIPAPGTATPAIADLTPEEIDQMAEDQGYGTDPISDERP